MSSLSPTHDARSDEEADRLPAGFQARWSDFVDPVMTLEELVDKAILEKSEGRQSTERLRAYILADPKTLLDATYQKQQQFLIGLDEYRARDARRKKYPGLRWFSAAMAVIGVLGGVLGFFLAFFMLGDALSIPVVWRFLIALTVLGLLALLFWLGFDVILDEWAMIVAVGLAVLIAIAGFVLGATEVLGNVGWGITLAVVVAIALATFTIVGAVLWIEFTEDSEALLQVQYDDWRAGLLWAAVYPALNAAFNRVKVEEYRLSLSLDHPVNWDAPRAVIDTAAASELRQHTAPRSKGSFALAGPRGSGKSTLLHRWASGAYTSPDSGANVVRRDLIVEVSAPVGYDHKEFLVYLFGRLCEAVEGYAERYKDPSTAPKSAWLTGRRASRASTQDLHTQGRPKIASLSELVQTARAERHAIRYLQSTTSAGELNAGIGYSGFSLGSKMSESVRTDNIPLNYPELVDEFRWFLEQASRVVAAESARGRWPRGGRAANAADGDDSPGGAGKASVLIAIDELDRISDGELAQKFINELKALFGVPNCFFLVSVSEDALAEFELSAMGMRTVFDSAFDEIVRVDYLGLHEAHHLLDRLIVGLPEPFPTLAYVLSGGLARQLVRIAYQMADMGQSSNGLSIDQVSARLVQRQLHKTVRAAIDRLFGSVGAGFGADLFRILDQLPSATPPSSTSLRRLETHLRGLPDEEGLLRGLPDGPDATKFAHTLRDEVASMCNYLATVLEVFNSDLDAASYGVRLQPGPTHFDNLARARRYLGANPHGADELLEAFRSASPRFRSRERAAT